jgi:hypothetical protein
MHSLKLEDRIRLEEQFISKTQKISYLNDEESQNILILEENIFKSISQCKTTQLKRYIRSFPEILDLLGVEKVVELFEPMYDWSVDKLLKDQYICINMLENIHILFSACKGWCGGADDISEVPELEENHEVFKNEEPIIPSDNSKRLISINF